MEHRPSFGLRSLMCIFVIFLLSFTAQFCDAKSDNGCKNPRFSNKGTRPSRSDEQRLLHDLLCNYDKESRPVKNYNNTLVVRFELKLIQVVSVSEKNQEMQTNVWITQAWENQIITWNASEYNGISNLNIDSQDIWVPTIILYNNAGQAFSGGPMKYKTKVILDSHGNHTWFAAVSFKSSCKFDVRYFPFDEQECVLTFGSWAYNSEKLDVIPARSKGDTSDYIQNGEWEIVDIPVTRVKQKYPCCEKTFSEVTYKVRMRRKVLYYLFNMILPCTIISTLAVLAFCTNPLSGQRITLSITVMLAMSVFLNFAWTRLPVTSESVPLLAKYYMLTMTEIGLSLFANCISLNYFYRDDALNYLPRFCRVSFIAWLAKVIAPIFCMQHPSSTSRLSKIIKGYIEEDETPSQYDTIAGRNDESDAWNTTNYESVVTIVDTPEDVKTTVRSTPKPRVKVTQLVKRKQQKPMPFKRLFLQEILEHTSTHALTAEPHEHYKNYKEYRKRREEDDIDVLVGSNVEQALLNELNNHKQFAAMIIDRFFLIIFLLTIALSFTTLLSGDTIKYVPE